MAKSTRVKPSGPTERAIELLSVAIAALAEEVTTLAVTPSLPPQAALRLQKAADDIAALAAALRILQRSRRLLG